VENLRIQCPSRQAFFQDFWESRPCHIDLNHLDSFEGLIDEIKWLKTLNLFELLELSAGDSILSWFFEADSSHSARYVTRAEAVNCFSDLATLYFHINDSSLPSIRACVVDYLGNIPFQLSVFASPKGSWVARHFDANNNFTLQLKGEKQWIYSPNQKIKLPTKNWMPDTKIDSEMLQYSPRFGSQFDFISGANTSNLIESDVFYMPRGYWHETCTIEDSFSLNICVPAITKARVFCEHLYQQLIRDVFWRQHMPVNVSGSLSRFDADANNCQKILGDLIRYLQESDSLAFQAETSQINMKGFKLSSETMLKKLASARFFVYDSCKNSEYFEAIFFAPDNSEITLNISPAIKKVLQTIDQSSLSTLKVKDLFVPNCSNQEVLEFLSILIEFGCISIDMSCED